MQSCLLNFYIYQYKYLLYFKMNYLILSQLFIGAIFLKFYRFLPVLERKNEKKSIQQDTFLISLIVYFIFSEISL